MNVPFDNKQIEFMRKIGIDIDFSKVLSAFDFETIEEKVSEWLQKNGFDKNYEPTQYGKVCESILDVL